MRRERLTDEFFVREWPVNFRRIEECYAVFYGCMDERQACCFSVAGP